MGTFSEDTNWIGLIKLPSLVWSLNFELIYGLKKWEINSMTESQENLWSLNPNWWSIKPTLVVDHFIGEKVNYSGSTIARVTPTCPSKSEHCAIFLFSKPLGRGSSCWHRITNFSTNWPSTLGKRNQMSRELKELTRMKRTRIRDISNICVRLV